MNRDEARELFAKSGLSYSDLTIDDLRLLRDTINVELKASKLISGYKMVGHIKTVDWPNGWAALRCKSYYFEDREAVTFNPGGFIGFAGWADDKNFVPIVDGFAKWVAAIVRHRSEVAA